MRSLLVDVGLTAPPEGMSWASTAEAARALAWLQHAAGAGSRLPPPPPGGLPPAHPPTRASSAEADAAAVPPDWRAIRRYLAFSLATYGSLFARL